MAKEPADLLVVMKGSRPGERLGSMQCTTLEGDSDFTAVHFWGCLGEEYEDQNDHRN